MKLHKHFYIAVVVLAVAAILGEVYFRWLVDLGMGKATPLSKPLMSIPVQLGDWEGEEIPLEPFLKQKIGAEDTLRRTYRRGTQLTLNLYIAYFGGVRGTAPHSPSICRPGSGFVLISNDTVEVTVPGFGEEPLRVHQDLYEKHFDKEVVVWWEYVHGENVAGRTWQRLKWALPGFLGGKRGSVLQVQISLAFKGDMDDSMTQIRDFMDRLAPNIRAVLPTDDTTQQQASR